MSWTNQYIPLVQNSTDYFLEQHREGFKRTELSSFKERVSQHQEIVLEIGSGSGMHLLKLAKLSPSTFFIGFELRYKRAFRTIEKAQERGLTNIFMIRGDARSVTELFEPRQISTLFVHYPDPWEKKRWNKNRIVQRKYLSPLIKLLREKGTLSFRTDHREYFHFATKELKAFEELEVLQYSEDLEKDLGEDFIPSSEFELLFTSQGKPVHSCVMRKKA